MGEGWGEGAKKRWAGRPLTLALSPKGEGIGQTSWDFVPLY